MIHGYKMLYDSYVSYAFVWCQWSKAPSRDHFVYPSSISQSTGLSVCKDLFLLVHVPHCVPLTLVVWCCFVSEYSVCQLFLCRLRSIAAHRDHFVRRLSVHLCVCLSGSQTFLIVTHSYVSQATHAFLGMLPLCLWHISHWLDSKAEKIEKVPRGIRGEKSSKDMASSRNLVSTIGALASPKLGDGARCPAIPAYGLMMSICPSVRQHLVNLCV